MLVEFLSYYLEDTWLSEFTCSSTEDYGMRHQAVTLVVHDRQEALLPCSFSGYGLQLYPDKQMKINDSDCFYSEDVSCTVILASSLLCRSVAISPSFGRFQAMQVFDKQWIDCFLSFLFNFCTRYIDAFCLVFVGFL